jgi:tetrahydromethanopterin:alpha-L-glutamate ligase
MTSFLLHRAGISTPATWVNESALAARKIMLRETAAGGDLVAKPLFGSQGEGLVRLHAGMDIPDAAAYNNVFYLQRFVDGGDGEWHDWRVFVVGGRAIAAMVRRGRSWISNVAQGARCEPCAMAADLAELATAAARAVGAEYCGVDIIRDRYARAYVLEVNSIPAWKGLQSVTQFNIAECIVEDLLTRKLKARLEAVG